MIGLLREEAHRDQQREVQVLVAGRLEAVVERALGQLPDGVAVRTDDHRPTRGAMLGQLGAPDDLDVPGREVDVGRGEAAGAHGAPMLADAAWREPGRRQPPAGHGCGRAAAQAALGCSPLRARSGLRRRGAASAAPSQRRPSARPGTPASISVALIGFAK